MEVVHYAAYLNQKRMLKGTVSSMYIGLIPALMLNAGEDCAEAKMHGGYYAGNDEGESRLAGIAGPGGGARARSRPCGSACTVASEGRRGLYQYQSGIALGSAANRVQPGMPPARTIWCMGQVKAPNWCNPAGVIYPFYDAGA